MIVGPGGLAYNSKNDTLYVAATGNNEIFAIAHAGRTHSDSGTGALVYQDQTHLHGPIGLALAPNGDLLTTNDDAVNFDESQPSELIEFSPTIFISIALWTLEGSDFKNKVSSSSSATVAPPLVIRGLMFFIPMSVISPYIFL